MMTRKIISRLGTKIISSIIILCVSVTNANADFTAIYSSSGNAPYYYYLDFSISGPDTIYSNSILSGLTSLPTLNTNQNYSYGTSILPGNPIWLIWDNQNFIQTLTSGDIVVIDSTNSLTTNALVNDSPLNVNLLILGTGSLATVTGNTNSIIQFNRAIGTNVAPLFSALFSTVGGSGLEGTVTENADSISVGDSDNSSPPPIYADNIYVSTGNYMSNNVGSVHFNYPVNANAGGVNVTTGSGNSSDWWLCAVL